MHKRLIFSCFQFCLSTLPLRASCICILCNPMAYKNIISKLENVRSRCSSNYRRLLSGQSQTQCTCMYTRWAVLTKWCLLEKVRRIRFDSQMCQSVYGRWAPRNRTGAVRRELSVAWCVVNFWLFLVSFLYWEFGKYHVIDIIYWKYISTWNIM